MNLPHDRQRPLPAIATDQTSGGFERNKMFLRVEAIAAWTVFGWRYKTTGFVVAHLLDAYLSSLCQIYCTQIVTNYHVKSSRAVRDLLQSLWCIHTLFYIMCVSFLPGILAFYVTLPAVIKMVCQSQPSIIASELYSMSVVQKKPGQPGQHRMNAQNDEFAYQEKEYVKVSVINVQGLTMFYKAPVRKEGLQAAFTSLFNRTYREIRAVQGISFEVTSGEVVGFIGPNGAGKTTTLKTLSGILHPTGGEVSVLGYTPSNRKPAFLRNLALIRV